MEWVEITARTVEEARDIALDQLGIDEQDAEIEVLEEPRPGLFGRLRGQARVRARVRPTTPRPKVDRRSRRRRNGERKEQAEARPAGEEPAATAATEADPEPAATGDEATEEATSAETGSGDPGEIDAGGGGESGSGARRRRRRRGGRRRRGRKAAAAQADAEQQGAAVELTMDEQADVVAEFLTGLAGAFGAAGTSTSRSQVDEETLEVRLDGSASELGLLIGPRGDTLQSIQELARTVVQRRGGGAQEGRIRVDIAGYRERRRAALERFTRQVAASVLETGVRKALEPMNAADRKVVHDTVNTIAGVRTISEGEEPMRRVVLVPDDQA